MLAMIFILTGAAMFFEYKVVTSVPFVGRLFEKKFINIMGKDIPVTMLPLVFSLVLSLMLGALFGAAGLICFVAGLLSTLCMQPIYAMMRAGTWGSTQVTIKAKKAAIVDGYTRNKNNIVATYHAVVSITMLIIKIVMIPVRIIAFILRIAGSVSDKVVK